MITIIISIYNINKYKFLFYVNFVLGQGVPSYISTREIGYLVKSVELPKFTVDVKDLNQYNRHTYIQDRIKYEPVTIKFHDDNNNLINKLWYAYYTYYYKDATQSDPIGSTSTIKMGDRRKTSDINSRNIYNKSISYYFKKFKNNSFGLGSEIKEMMIKGDKIDIKDYLFKVNFCIKDCINFSSSFNDIIDNID